MSKKRQSIAILSCIALLILLGLFQSVWIIGGSSSGIMLQCGLQRTRMQAIAKDMLTLAYRPAIEHAQAIGELQIALPLFEQTQRGLQVGDASLALPSRVPETIQALVAIAQPDYLAIDVAARKITAHADAPVDPIELQIVLSHEHSYAMEMTQITNAWQQQIDATFLHIFWIESALTALVLILVIWIYVRLKRVS